jgi:hypothetical protein
MDPVAYLTGIGYRRAKILATGNWGAIMPLMYHSAIIEGTVGGIEVGYIDRWCFTNEGVDDAFDAWDGTAEPVGWHRHPGTGRRRPDGDASREYIDY